MTDTTEHDADSVARSVFAGLVPNVPVDDEAPQERSRRTKGVMTTVPILLVGSLAAMTLNVAGPAESASAKRPSKPKIPAAEIRKTVQDAVQASNAAAAETTPSIARPAFLSAPQTYRVVADDTVSSIAGRYGLSTASVLALNGLGWSSLIFPGQVLKLTTGNAVAPVETPADATPSGRYTIVSGDTISAIAHRFGVSTLSVLSANGLGWSSIIYPGQTIAIPGLIGPGTPEPQPITEQPVVTVDETTQDDAPAAETDPVIAPPVVDTTPPPADTTVPEPPAAAPAPPAPDPAPVTNGSYTIVSGDTVSRIASMFGITTQSLLDANGLDWSSVIYIGGILVIPGVSAPASTGGNITYLNDEMRGNAAVIVQVGRNLGVPDYGIVIALAAAMQESSMRNINWGDLDSVGLFQQRPSAGWGSVDLLTTPSYAAALFYGGPSNPNRGYTRGLLDIRGWQNMSVTQAAQAVQISGYPNAYAKWEASARAWLAELG